MTKIQLFNKKKGRIKLTDFIYKYISNSKKGDLYKNSYRNVANHLLNFEKKTGILIYTDSFSEQVAEEFILYLKTEGRIKGSTNSKGLGLMQNTIKTIIDKIAAMIKRSGRQGYPVNYDYECIQVSGEDPNAVYLTVDELNKLNELGGLSKQSEAVRDRFLVGCFTALRFSDYSTINTSNIIKGNFEVKTKKTGTKVIIPIHPIIIDIIKRNKGDLPSLPSQQSFGKTIKRICKKAKIVHEVLYERTIGTKIVRKKMPKWELVSSHTARRTGATNMYISGIPVFRIMLITGHRTEQSFFKYIRIGKEENAIELKNFLFFKNDYLYSKIRNDNT